jgi:hypothetical protein
MCVFIMFVTFLEYLANSRDLIYCRPSLTIATLIVTSDCFYLRQKPVKQDVREDKIEASAGNVRKGNLKFLKCFYLGNRTSCIFKRPAKIFLF